MPNKVDKNHLPQKKCIVSDRFFTSPKWEYFLENVKYFCHKSKNNKNLTSIATEKKE